MERFYDHQPHQPPLLRLQVHNVAKLFRKTPIIALEIGYDGRFYDNQPYLPPLKVAFSESVMQFSQCPKNVPKSILIKRFEIVICSMYSSVPNRRVGQNKRAGGKILRKH